MLQLLAIYLTSYLSNVGRAPMLQGDVICKGFGSSRLAIPAGLMMDKDPRLLRELREASESSDEAGCSNEPSAVSSVLLIFAQLC